MRAALGPGSETGRRVDRPGSTQGRHGAAGTSRLVPPEQKAWQQFWSEVGQLLLKVQTQKEKSKQLLVRTFTGHKGPVTCVAFSADLKFGLSAGFDKTVRLWDLRTGKEVRQFKHDDVVW